ncbi:MAG: LOG family protein [Anaerolineae bacterium]|nr:LOG family protein [Anaerolineae bacterium]
MAWRRAYELGERLAQSGWVIANGGYGGTMAAVSQGAHDAGGYVIGVTCALFDPTPPNPWLSEERKAPSLIARMEEIISLGDAFIALPGGIGTLAEVTLVWSMLQTRSLSPRPFILIGRPWAGLVNAFKRYTEMGDSILALARLAADVDEAMTLLDA